MYGERFARGRPRPARSGGRRTALPDRVERSPPRAARARSVPGEGCGFAAERVARLRGCCLLRQLLRATLALAVHVAGDDGRGREDLSVVGPVLAEDVDR